jgi:NAD(P)-dependent dehydrogenase (short-subunit alcohol dehydrogenase family)
MKIQDKNFVVTGGGNGIGREVVLGLLRQGARIDAIDLRREGLDETGRLAGDRGESYAGWNLDVTDRSAVATTAAEIIAARGQIDGLVNVAGIIQRFAPFAELSVPEMEKVMAVNFWGPVYLVKAFLPELITRPEASLVEVSSMGGLAPVPGQTVYGASKAAVKLFTEGLYAELRDTNVAVTVVFPGGVATGITENSGVAAPTSAIAAGEAAKMASKLTTPQDAAARIIAGIEQGSYRVVIGRDARMLDRLSRLAPQRATDMIAKRMASLVG